MSRLICWPNGAGDGVAQILVDEGQRRAFGSARGLDSAVPPDPKMRTSRQPMMVTPVLGRLSAEFMPYCQREWPILLVGPSETRGDLKA